MAKTLRTAALVVGAVALAATGVGAFVGAAAVTATLGGISAVALTAAASGLSLAATLTAKKPGASATGSPTEFVADPQAFIPYVIGRTATSGNIVFRRGFDTKDKGENDRQAFAVILSGAGPVNAIESFTVDRVAVGFDAGGNALGYYHDFMWQRRQLGAAPEASALAFGGGNPPGWTAAHKLSGYAAASWTLRFDTKAKFYQNGVPTPRWVVQGVKVYDPRLDGTYPGGAGPCRVDDEATWIYSENPFVHGLAWVTGRHQNGKRVLGIEAPVAGIDIAAFVEGANVADANGWKAGGVVYSGDNKWEVLKRILQAGMGEPMALGAKISCFVNAPKVSLATINAGDLVGEGSVTATRPRRERINSITPRYRLEANNWELLPGTPITVDAHVAEDGGKRSREQDYPLIQSTLQVATAVRYDIENAREFGPIVLALKPLWVGYKPGDCVTATIPELGLNGQTILILNRDLDPASGVPTLTARSETAAKHPFALGQTTTPPPTPGVTGPPLVPVPGADAWAITRTLLETDGAAVPALVIEGQVDAVTAEAIIFEYRPFQNGLAADEGWIAAGIEPPATLKKEIASVTGDTAYEASVSYRARGVVGARLILGPAITGRTAVDAGDVYYPPVPGGPDRTPIADLRPSAPGADVTIDAIENSRFFLATPDDRVGTESRPRFDPIFWTCNFPNTMIASLRATATELRVDATFHEKNQLAGIIWESVDHWDHPTTAYDTNRDYRNCVLRFRCQLAGDVLPFDDVNGPVLTIEGRDAGGAARTWYVLLGNSALSGVGDDAIIEFDFDDLRAGFYGTDSAYAGDVDRIFISLTPKGYDAGGGRLGAPAHGQMILSEMTVTGSNSRLVCGTGPGGVHEVKMANGYDDTYNITPARIVRNVRLLGYKGVLNHYVGMSHYFNWAWDEGEDRFIAQDDPLPLNEPCAAWHSDFAALLHEAGVELILSLSYEMLNAFIPAGFRQFDANGAPALTGWAPPSSLFSPCNPAGMAYLQRVAKQFCAIAAAAGQRVRFQVGEPWYWVDFRTQVPCFYDPSTTAKYLADTGKAAPAIANMKDPMNGEQLAYLDWLGEQLAASILALIDSVRAEHVDLTSYALLYLPQMLDERTPELKRVNMPAGLAYPALDVLQVEDYDFVIENRADLSASGRASIEDRLGYPRSKQQYFAGFALFKDTGPVWRYSTNAIQAAVDYGVFPIFVWAYTQVVRDGYVPLVRMGPAPGLGDLADVELAQLAPQDGDVIYYRADLKQWVPGKPWLA